MSTHLWTEYNWQSVHLRIKYSCSAAREPAGQGSNDPPEIYLGVKHGIVTPPQILCKEIFSGTHPHRIYIIIILYSETRSRNVFFLLSFITDLWTPQNVALRILTPKSKNSSRAPAAVVVYNREYPTSQYSLCISRRVKNLSTITFMYLARH